MDNNEVEYKTLIVSNKDDVAPAIQNEVKRGWRHISTLDYKSISNNEDTSLIVTFIRLKEEKEWTIAEDKNNNIIICFKGENHVFAKNKSKITQLKVLEYDIVRQYAESSMEVLMRMVKVDEHDIKSLRRTFHSMFSQFEYDYINKTSFITGELETRFGSDVTITTVKENYTIMDNTTPIPVELFEGEYTFSSHPSNKEQLSTHLKMKFIGLNLENNHFGKMYSLLYKLYLEGAAAEKSDIALFFKYLNREVPDIFL